MGIKKGSTIWPLMTLVVVFVGLYITFSSDNNAASNIYSEVCKKVADSLAKDASSGAVVDKRLSQFTEGCSANTFQSGTYDAKIRAFSELTENHVAPYLGDHVLGMFPAFFHLATAYLKTEFLADLTSSWIGCFAVKSA